VRAAVLDAAALVTGDVPGAPAIEPDPDDILGADLLSIPAIRLAPDALRPAATDPVAVRDAIRASLADGRLPLREVCLARMGPAHKDVDGAERIVDRLAQNVPEAGDLGGLRARVDEAWAIYRAELAEAARRAREAVEANVMDGLLSESARGAALGQIESVDRTLATRRDLAEPLVVMGDIVAAQTAIREAEAGRLRAALARDVPASSEVTRARIAAAIADGDVLTAREYLAAVTRGEPLREEGDATPARPPFFPDAHAAIHAYLAPHEGAAHPITQPVLDALRERARLLEAGRSPGRGASTALGPVDLSAIDPAHVRGAADLLDAWFTVRRMRTLSTENVRRIMEGLGFTLRGLDTEIDGRYVWALATTSPISNPAICPVEVYGSEAHGRYSVLCAWDGQAGEEILAEIASKRPDSPVIIWYFGRLSAQGRRDLGQLCRQRRRTCILLDDALLVYLCGERGVRLPALLAAALPFTFLEPYNTTTGGLVPVEMFYGREWEREQIERRDGSCLIFGGRQLGKTALLRDVERRFHDPSKGYIFRLFDVRGEQATSARNSCDLWPTIAAQLQQTTPGIFPGGDAAGLSDERIRAHIETWIASDPSRRIVLLLDEADDFLRQDAVTGAKAGARDGFAATASIKALMDRTDRRFKVVLAGLHNVQRTARERNNPLAHLGPPLCIGPLLGREDAQAARALIEQPLGLLGYRFESPRLVLRILSQTNYYPSLIQLYCHHLLQLLSDPRAARVDERDGPPHAITAAHLDEVFLNQDLRDAIRYRFRLTLELDTRYEVIAYAMALAVREGDERGIAEGFDLAWIKAQALSWWAKGFAGDATDDAFRVLLGEMVGLGVLRDDEGRYAFRSASVVSMLGRDEEISAFLLSDEHKAPDIYEPGSYRAAMRVPRSDVPWRAPLTAAQIAAIRDRTDAVSIIASAAPAALSDAPAALAAAFSGPLARVRDIADLAHFERALAEAAQITRPPTPAEARASTGASGRRRASASTGAGVLSAGAAPVEAPAPALAGPRTVIVSRQCPWTEAWVEAGARLLECHPREARGVRVVFMADPPTVWDLLRQGEAVDAMLRVRGVTLGPWHESVVREWVHECGFGVFDDADRAAIAAATGGWPTRLRALYDRARGDKRRWREHLAAMDAELADATGAEGLCAEFGLRVAGLQRRALARLAEWGGEASVDDLCEIYPDMPCEEIERAMRWADVLGLAALGEKGLWRLDPLVARILGAAGPGA